jgi:hypothetical protein
MPAEGCDCDEFGGEAVEDEAEWSREALIERVSQGYASAVLERLEGRRDADGGK